MPRLPLRLLSLLFSAAAAGSLTAAGQEHTDTIHIPPKIEWEKIAELPPGPDGKRNPGLAGVFAGAHGDVFLIAGGSNYPDNPPWQGGQRAFHRDIHVLERTLKPDGLPLYHWTPAGAQLPDAMACGASVSLSDGVLCIGGATTEAVRDECFLLSWNKTARQVESQPFPKLPKPLACHTAVLLLDTVYVIGGTADLKTMAPTASFFALDLTKRQSAKDFVWKELRAWDGPPRIYAVAAASLEGEVESLYLCGGRQPGGEPDFLIDLHKFNPLRKEWTLLGDVVDRRGHPGHVMATPAFHVPPHHFVVIGGMDEDITRLLERNSREFGELDDVERARRKKYEQLLMENFPGYPRTVLGYDAEIGEWNHIGNFPGEVPLTNPAVNWESQIIIPGGETGPGRRSPDIWAGTVRKKPIVIEEAPEDEEPPPSGQGSVNAPPELPPPPVVEEARKD